MWRQAAEPQLYRVVPLAQVDVVQPCRADTCDLRPAVRGRLEEREPAAVVHPDAELLSRNMG